MKEKSKKNNKSCLIYNCKKFDDENCLCNQETCTYIYKQYSMKRWVYGIIITVISVGLIVPFFSEAVCTIWFPGASIGLNTWNQFVGIILGIVATVVSIVSLIMGFKNYDDGLELHEKHVQTLEKISTISKDVNDVKEKLDKINILNDSKSEAPSIPAKIQWDPDPDIPFL